MNNYPNQLLADQREQEIEELAADASLKYQILEAIGMRNTFGLTVQERIKLDVEYAKAKGAYLEASRKLTAAYG